MFTTQLVPKYDSCLLVTRAQGRVELGFARTSTFLIFEEQILSMLNLNIKMKKTRVIMEITALVSI